MDNQPGAQQPDLKQLIVGSVANRPAPVNAHTYLRNWPTASKPVALKCDDGNVYVVKARQAGNPGMDRVIANEQIVGRLGMLIHAPIPTIAQVEVSALLIANQPEMAHMTPGLAHGSLYSDDLSERLGIINADVPQNRPRFALLAILYGWVVASDYQYFYTKSVPQLVYSVDHAYFFPNGHTWSVDSLAHAPQAQPDQSLVQACHLTEEELRAAIQELSAIDLNALACTVALPPEDWGLSLDERVALLEFLLRRRGVLLDLLPA